MALKTKGIVLGLVMMLLLPSIGQAQAVFLARKALGLISRIADETHGHETASVLLEADADKVFMAAERIIGKGPENKILSINAADRFISFKHGSLSISLKVARL